MSRDKAIGGLYMVYDGPVTAALTTSAARPAAES